MESSLASLELAATPLVQVPEEPTSETHTEEAKLSPKLLKELRLESRHGRRRSEFFALTSSLPRLIQPGQIIEEHEFTSFCLKLGSCLKFFLEECSWEPWKFWPIQDANSPLDVLEALEAFFVPEILADKNKLADDENIELVARLSTVLNTDNLSFPIRKEVQKLIRDLSIKKPVAMKSTMIGELRSEKTAVSGAAHGEHKLKSLSEMISKLNVSDLGEHFHRNYLQNIETLKFEPDEYDPEHLELLLSNRLNFDKIRQLLENKEVKKVLDRAENRTQYIKYCSVLSQSFNDHAGSFSIGKLKSHVMFWRTIWSSSFIESTYLNLIDNVLALMMVFDQVIAVDANDKPRRESRDFDYYKAFAGVKIYDYEDEKELSSSFGTLTQAFSTLNCRGSSKEKIEENLVKPHAEPLPQLPGIRKHIWFTFLLCIVVLTGTYAIWYQWRVNATSITRKSINSFNMIANDAALRSIKDYSNSANMIINSMQSFFDSNVNLSILTDDEVLRSFLVREVSLFDVQSVHFTAPNGRSLRASRTAEKNTHFIWRSRSDDFSCLEAQKVTRLNENLLQLGPILDPYCNFNAASQSWYTRVINCSGDVLSHPECVSGAWTSPYQLFGSEEFGITLSKPFRSNNSLGFSEFRGVFGVDLLLSGIHLAVKQDLASSYAGAVIVFNDSGSVLVNSNQMDFTRSQENAAASATVEGRALTLLKEEYGSLSNIRDLRGSSVALGDLVISLSRVESPGLSVAVASVFDASRYQRRLDGFGLATVLLMIAIGMLALFLSYEIFQVLFPTFRFSIKAMFAVFFQKESQFRDTQIERRKTLRFLHRLISPIHSYKTKEDIGSNRSEKAWSNFQDDESSEFLQNLKEKWRALRNGMFEKWRSFKDGLRYISVKRTGLIISFSVLLLWAMWTYLGQKVISEVADTALHQSLVRVISAVLFSIERPPVINGFNKNLFFSNAYTASSSASNLQSRDRAFQRSMMDFRIEDQSYVINAMYVAFESSGHFAGAQILFNNSETATLAVLARDNTTNGCYHKYEPLSKLHQDAALRDTRDMSRPLFSSCDFDPRQRPWYQTAKAQAHEVWSDIYAFEGRDVLGITYSSPIFDQDGHLIGVFGTDLELSLLSNLLEEISLDSENKARKYVLTKDNIIVASSLGNISISSGKTISGNATGDSIVDETTEALLLLPQGLESIHGNKIVARALNEPLTFVSRIEQTDKNLDWFVVVAVSSDSFYLALDVAQIKSFIFAAMTISVASFLISTGFKGPLNRRKKQVNETLDFEGVDKKAHIRIAYDKTSLEYWRMQMNHLIRMDLIDSWRSNWNSDRRGKQQNDYKEIVFQSPVPSSEFATKCLKKSMEHVKASFEEKDVIYNVLLNSLFHSPRVYSLYSIVESNIFRITFSVIVFGCHISLGLFKPPSLGELRQVGIEPWVWVFEGFIIALELFKAGVDVIVLRTVFVRNQDALKEFFSIDEEDEDEAFARSIGAVLSTKFKGHLDSALNFLFILIVVFVDWILIATLRFSIEYFLPLRALIILYVNRSVRNVARGFWKTMKGARAEFVLYFTAILFAGVSSIIMFRTLINVGEVEDSFGNIVRSLTTAFIYFSTSENFVSLVYFVFLTILGTFIVLAFILSSFVRGFTREFQTELLTKQQWKRSGLIAAYLLLDIDDNGRVSSKLIRSFAAGLDTMLAPDLAKPDLEKLDLDRYKKLLLTCKNIESFVEIMEDAYEDCAQLQYNFRFKTTQDIDQDDEKETPLFRQDSVSRITVTSPETKRSDQEKSSKQKILDIVAHEFFESTVAFLVLCQTGLLCFYGLISNQLLDPLNFLIILFFIFEICLKIYAHGFNAFLSPTSFRYPQHSRLNTPEWEVANRIDFFAVSLSAFCVILGFILNKGFIISDENSTLRFGMAFTTLRLFTTLPSSRRLIYPIFVPSVLTQFVYLSILLLDVLYVFSVYGVLFLRGRFTSSILKESLPDARFDDLRTAMVSCFQLLVGEAWDSIMYAAVKTTRGFSIAWFFIFFMIINSFLFINVFISLILSVMEKFGGRDDLSKKDLRKKIFASE